jgi:TatD DNase family protein
MANVVQWTDNHCHLPAGADAAGPIERARAAGVTRLITVGTDAEHSRQAIEIAAAHDGVWATVGLHPHDASNGVDSIVGLLDEPRVVAVGECGLDYYYDHAPRGAQRTVFAAQIALAFERDLALVIHTRDAWADTFDLLGREGVPDRTVLHCFTGGPAEARRALDLGIRLSFSGIVTFKNAGDLREAAALCPLDQLLVETDSPYLAPVPHRGRPNEPALVPLVGAAIAAVKGVSVDDVATASSAAADQLYRLAARFPAD